MQNLGGRTKSIMVFSEMAYLAISFLHNNLAPEKFEVITFLQRFHLTGNKTNI